MNVTETAPSWLVTDNGHIVFSFFISNKFSSKVFSFLITIVIMVFTGSLAAQRMRESEPGYKTLAQPPSKNYDLIVLNE